MSHSIISFIKDVPQENKIYQSDFLSSMLFLGIIEDFKENKNNANFILSNLFFIADIRDPREWEILEYSFFAFLYFNDVPLYGESYTFHIKKYRKKMFLYYKLGKKDFINFYNRISYKEIRGEVKKSLRRRWGKKMLNIYIDVAEEAVNDKNMALAWTETVNAYLEAVFLFYTAKNICNSEIDNLKEKAKKIYFETRDKSKLAPFIEFSM